MLFDTHVILDALLKRNPFGEDARRLVGHVEKRRVDGLLCATTLTTVHCVASKAIGEAKTRRDLKELLGLFQIAPVDHGILRAALALRFGDFEAAALPVYAPAELRAALRRA